MLMGKACFVVYAKCMIVCIHNRNRKSGMKHTILGIDQRRFEYILSRTKSQVFNALSSSTKRRLRAQLIFVREDKKEKSLNTSYEKVLEMLYWLCKEDIAVMIAHFLGLGL